MADDGSKQDAVWPLPKFYFSVDIGGIGKIPFQEVSGLDAEAEPIEYRADDTEAFSTIKMPGLANHGNVTLKKGVFVKDNKFWDWYSQIKMNTIKRESVTISLLDQEGNPTMVWKLRNAFPVKITGTDLKSDGNEVAVETLEIAHEGVTIENA
ncbi:phage tail protein [Pacificoceanicola onchidii]|uniref:phage tail protein n=1 Tax=Pacificoceanicola onchidii TaxID=2562685 RepID=UPI0010A3B523|nr:phage tail protein [Pacificoceanicola onchidii]